jgi:ATP-dependent helicase/nuclease subunit A
MILSPKQLLAVRRQSRNVCVVAGPGSGKTRVLIERFAWLIEEQRVDPSRILAITFTEKAANEIKSRLVERFSARIDLREAVERAWVSTIHGFCARLLREHAVAAGLSPDFGVLEQAWAERLARESADEALDALYRERPVEVRRLLESLDISTQDSAGLAGNLLNAYESMRMAGPGEAPPPAADRAWDEARELAREILRDPVVGRTDLQRAAHPKIREWASAFLALPADRVTPGHFRAAQLTLNRGHLVGGSRSREAAGLLREQVLPKLEAQWLAQANAGSLSLLRDAIARIDGIYLAKKRREAALDFSDLEEETIRLLEGDAALRLETASRFDQILMDELQDTSRLQWRLVNLIRENFFAVGDINQSIYSFRHAEPAVFHEYRSALEQAGGDIDDLRENYRSSSQILDVVSQMLDAQPGIEARPLDSVRGPASHSVVERIVGSGEAAEDVEAALVAARIREWTDSGQLTFGDIAVLVRAMAATEPFERQFDRFDIPFVTTGGRTFFEAREVRDLMALLAALVNPLDQIAVVGVLRSPLGGLSDEQIFAAGPEGRLAAFEDRFGRLRSLAGFGAPDFVLAKALDECGYAAGLSERARMNIEKFLGLVRRRHRARPQPLAELLEDLEALRESATEAEAPPPEAGNAVRLMSIHAAKGLEFKIVCVSALHRGPDRSRPVIAFSSEAGLGAKWRNPATGDGQPDAVLASILEQRKEREEAEEHRLLYVAMTRAEDRLILSYAQGGRPSRWQKLAESAVPNATIAGQPPDPPQLPAGAEAARAEEIFDAPPTPDQYDSTASVTAIAQFQACPRKYFLNDVTWGMPDAGGTGAMELGTEVHRVLAGGASANGEADELAARFQSSELGLRSARASRSEREFDFLMPIGGVVLRGQIDLWFEESGEIVVVDYKTDRGESSADEYALQLRLYALAIEHYTGRVPDRAVLYYLRSDRTVEVSLERKELEEAKSAVRAFSRAQESMEFPIRPGEQCRRCAFYGKQCPARLD